MAGAVSNSSVMTYPPGVARVVMRAVSTPATLKFALFGAMSVRENPAANPPQSERCFCSPRNEQGQRALVRAGRHQRRNGRQVEVKIISVGDAVVVKDHRELFPSRIRVERGRQIAHRLRALGHRGNGFLKIPFPFLRRQLGEILVLGRRNFRRNTTAKLRAASARCHPAAACNPSGSRPRNSWRHE